MDVEFFIHGVPKGESFWGKSEEKNFLGQFYDGKTDVEKMYIYSRSLNGANFVYYTYLVSNTIDVNGRSGAYQHSSVEKKLNYTTNSHKLS